MTFSLYSAQLFRYDGALSLNSTRKSAVSQDEDDVVGDDGQKLFSKDIRLRRVSHFPFLSWISGQTSSTSIMSASMSSVLCWGGVHFSKSAQHLCPDSARLSFLLLLLLEPLSVNVTCYLGSLNHTKENTNRSQSESAPPPSTCQQQQSAA